MTKLIHWVFVALFSFTYLSTSVAEINLDQVRQSAAKGQALEQAKLGAAFYLGKGVTEDKKQAAEWLLKAAEEGLIEAEVMMAAMYDIGLGVQQSAGKSTAWYQKAAKQGHEASAGILKYYEGPERAIKAQAIAKQYAKEILKK